MSSCNFHPERPAIATIEGKLRCHQCERDWQDAAKPRRSMTTQERLAGWEGEVVVTQADRDAAFTVLVHSDDNGGWGREYIRDGGDDGNSVVQTFARHRRSTLEEAAKACEDQQAVFMSPRYATGQPLSSFGERFACGRCAEAIRNLAPPRAVVGEGG